MLVLLHPLGADRHVWEPVLERLAAERDVIAVDLPGFGELAGAQRRRAADARALAAAVASRGLARTGRTTSPATRSAAGSRSSSPPPATRAR